MPDIIRREKDSLDVTVRDDVVEVCVADNEDDVAAIRLDRDEAAKVAAALLDFASPRWEGEKVDDPCAKHVDMRDIKATEIRGHWRHIAQQNVEMIRFLNHMERLTGDQNKIMGKIEYAFGQMLEALTTSRKGQQLRDEERNKLLSDILKEIESVDMPEGDKDGA